MGMESHSLVNPHSKGGMTASAIAGKWGVQGRIQDEHIKTSGYYSQGFTRRLGPVRVQDP